MGLITLQRKSNINFRYGQRRHRRGRSSAHNTICGHLWPQSGIMRPLSTHEILLGPESTTGANVTWTTLVILWNEYGAVLQRNLRRKTAMKQRGGQDEELSLHGYAPTTGMGLIPEDLLHSPPSRLPPT